ncbi:MAG: MtrB/PioB family outer membrane beta-barrel protein [Vicinamibacteria bacterium]
MKTRLLVTMFILSGPFANAQTPPEGKPAVTPATEKPVAPPDAPMTDDWKAGTVTFGAQQTDSSSISSKFMEYREVPNGVVAPQFRFQGKKNALRYDFIGENITQTDQRFRMRLGNETWRVEGDYNRIPHNFGNGGHTLLEETSEGVWQISDTLQRSFQNTLESTVPKSAINFPFLLALVSPSLAAANTVDVKLTRERGNLTFISKPSSPIELKVIYSRERRTGSRAASGTSFGFGNVVELPEPLHYLTQDFGVEGQYDSQRVVVRLGAHVNQFSNRIQSLTFDNPFRVTDSTDPSSYLAPGSASTGGAATGRIALPPDNEAVIGNVSVMFKLRDRTRLSIDGSVARSTQNKSPFLAYSTNTAITTPLAASNVSTLPAQRLDGKADVRSLNVYFTSQPVPNLSLTARAQVYDFANHTPRITFPGYARFDGPWIDIARISVPYGYKSGRLDATAGYRFGDLSVEAGLKRVTMDRTFRETESTTENGVSLAASLRRSDWLVVRASYEKAKRDFDGLDIEKSEDASFVTPGAAANIFAIPSTTLQTTGQSLCAAGTVCNLRFDQSKKDIDRVGAHVAISPNDKVTLSAGYLRTKDNYKESRFGLISAQFDNISFDVDLAASEKVNAYAFYSREKVADFQVGRQSGATPSNNPIDDWTSTVGDKTDSLGLGADLILVPDKWFVTLAGQYQKVDGNNTLFSAAGSAASLARSGIGGVQSLPLYDDTRIASLSAEARYQFTPEWTFSFGAILEDYSIKDLASTGLTNYVPASFFLAANDGDYTAKTAYVRFTYHF